MQMVDNQTILVWMANTNDIRTLKLHNDIPAPEQTEQPPTIYEDQGSYF